MEEVDTFNKGCQLHRCLFGEGILAKNDQVDQLIIDLMQTAK